MTKTEEFRACMRAVGYRAPDALIDELACLLRMAIRLGVEPFDTPSVLVLGLWGHMLQPMLAEV
jgi:hypothetical protein